MATNEPGRQHSPRCHLLRLPPELRCIIYGFVFGNGERELRFGCADYETKMRWYTSKIERYMTIHAEAVKVLYDQTLLEVPNVSRSACSSVLPAFVDFPRAELISDVHLEVDIHDNACGGIPTDSESAKIVLSQLDYGRRLKSLDLEFCRFTYNSDERVDQMLSLLEALECKGRIHFKFGEYGSRERPFYKGEGYDRLCQTLQATAGSFSCEFFGRSEFA